MGPEILSGLPYQSGVTTRQISAENPTGEKSGGCRWDPDPTNPTLRHSAAALELGRGWKVRPFISVAARETVTLADIEGPGCINEIFLTSNVPEYRALVLRFYWDEEETPSVETPLGDFFAMGHDTAPHPVSSLPVVVAPHRGCNGYWQMPFRKHARITLENEAEEEARIVAYRILYKLLPIPDEAAYFHAQWRRSTTRREYPEHVIVDGVRGSGVYVGTYLAWTALSRGWWGEGEVKFYLDGDAEFPTMADNGTEDYFGGAWGFDAGGREQEFSTPFLGLPLASVSDHAGPRRYSLYRWHLLDGIGFAQDLRATVQALGWRPDRRYEPLTDDIASVAYWYQREPHAPFPRFPALPARRSHPEGDSERADLV
ncbi:MAG TPA: glycoside hydrolase family 172 protein [Chthonomonadaceae bacterium]|nr:glycoside hydrolase family 172 protein [Chthonomonadaceae bacterium]